MNPSAHLRLFVLVGCSVLAGCNADPIANLEKQNTEMKASLDKQKTSMHCELRAKRRNEAEKPATGCDVQGSTCKSGDEFEGLFRPYLND